MAFEIPGFQILSIIGKGGMGTVYKAKQVSMDRLVAIKVLSEDLCKDKAFATRFVREARSLARLNHANIVSAIDVGEAYGVYYYVMEYIEGRPVSALIKEGRIPEKRALEIGLEVAQGLAHAGRHQLIHRDIKPQNLLVAKDGHVKICDFGLVKQTSLQKTDSEQVTIAEMFVGTPMYVSPEQARGEKEIDIRTDLYSLGATLYHMMVGQPPFTGNTAMEIMAKHLTEVPPLPRKRAPELSDASSRILLKLLAKEPAKRYQTPDDLIVDLQSAYKMASLSPADRPMVKHASRRVDPVAVPQKKSSAGLAVGIIAGLAAVGIGIFLVAGSSSPKPRARPPDEPVAAKPEPPPVAPPKNDGLDEKFQQDFKAYSQNRKALWDQRAPDRITEPYERLRGLIERNKGNPLESRWNDELKKFMAETEEQIAPIWKKVKAQADIPGAMGQWGTALEALQEFPKDLLAFADPKATTAGAELAALRADLERKIEAKFAADLKSLQDARRRPDFDAAWITVQSMAFYIDASRHELLQQQRLGLLQAEYESLMKPPIAAAAVKKTQERMNDLASKLSANPPVASRARELAAEASRTYEAAIAGTQKKTDEAMSTAIRPALELALSQRDTVKARKIIVEFLCSDKYADLRPALRYDGADIESLKPLLDAKLIDDAGPLSKKIEGMPGILREANATLADLLMYGRFAALMEELYVRAYRGLDDSRGNASRLKASRTALLKGASRLEDVSQFSAPGINVAADIKKDGGKSSLMISPLGDPFMDHEDVVMFARFSYPGGKSDVDPTFSLKAGLHYYYMKHWPKAVEELSKAGDPAAIPLLSRAKGELANGTPPPADPGPKPMPPDPPKDPKKPPAKPAKTAKYPFKGKWKELGKDIVEVTYDFSEESQLDDFETGSFLSASAIKASWKKDKTLRLEGQGSFMWKAPLEDDVTIEVVFTSDKEGFGLQIHSEGDNKSGYLSYLDYDTSWGAQWGVKQQFLNDRCLVYKLPLNFQDFRSMQPMVAKPGAPVTRGQKSTAWMRRKGDGVDAGLGSVTASGKNNEYNSGRTGITMGESNITVHSIKITGKVNAKWLKEQQQ